VIGERSSNSVTGCPAPGKAGRTAGTREPGNLPVAVVPSCGRGAPHDRGRSSR